MSTSSRSLSFLEALGPPMEERGGADTFGLALERRAVSELRVFEFLDALEMAVDERSVGERPPVPHASATTPSCRSSDVRSSRPHPVP